MSLNYLLNSNIGRLKGLLTITRRPSPPTHPDIEAAAEFQRLLHTEYSSRREAIDQRALLLSGLAIGQVAAIVAFRDPLTHNYPEIVKQLVAAGTFALALIAASFTLRLVLPIRRRRSVRRNAAPTSLTWFFDVATYEPGDFHDRITRLSNMEMVAELARLNVNVAGLLRTRYKAMIRAGSALSLSLWFTVGVLVVNSVIPYATSLLQSMAWIKGGSS